MKQSFFEELSHLKSWVSFHWVLGGDFNITRFSHEHSSRVQVSPIMTEFNNFITSVSLVDFSPNNCLYTWSNFQVTSTMVKLDRFLVSQGWKAHFPRAIWCGKARIISDHIYICLDTQPPGWRPFPFKFYKSWMFREGFEEFIWNTLDNISLGENVIPLFSAKLKKLKLAIKEWLSSRRIDHKVN